MNDLLHDTTDVAIALCKVERTELCRRLVVVGVRLELRVSQSSSVCVSCIKLEHETYDGMRTPLCPDNPTHRKSGQRS